MDLAEVVEDLICTFDGSGDTTMDTLAMFIFGWILAALFVLWLGKIIYAKFQAKTKANEIKSKIIESASKTTDNVDSAEIKNIKKVAPLGKSAGGYVPPTPPVRKRLTRQSPAPEVRKPKFIPAPQCTGPDNVCVSWVNEVFQWLYNDFVIVNELLGVWIQALNDYTKKSVSEDLRPLEVRLNEHKNNIRRGETEKSKISEHVWEHGHHIQWKNAKILEKEPMTKKRKLKETAIILLNGDKCISNHSVEFNNTWLDILKDEQGIGVELVRILPETHPPILTNIFAEADSRDDVTITCDFEATPAFQLKSFRQKGDKVDTSHYRVDVNRYRARLNIFCVSEKLQANIKCDGWPEIKIALAPVGNIKNNLDETQLQEVISEILMTALRNSEVNLNLAQYPTCPRLVRHVATPGQYLPLHYDSMSTAYTSTPNHLSPNLWQSPGEKRLLVKVIRASGLGASQGCAEPFCVVEMDEPPQKNQTSIQKNTNSPFWDEHFLFDLTPNTAELLFEVYDHAVKPHKFLGLGIVGVEELLVNQSQRQIIALQSRPYESDPVSGTLNVEFQFIEGADIQNIGGNQPYKIKECLRTPSPNRVRLTNTTTTFHNDNLMNGNHLADSAVRDLERNKLYNANKSTLVIHSVQRQPSQRLVKVELSDGNWKEIERVEVNLDIDEKEEPKDNITQTEEQTNGAVVTEVNGDSKDITNKSEASKPGDFSTTNTLQSQSTDIEFRGRPRKRRDFFGTIKRRLGKSKNRSKSAGPENDVGRDDSLNRSISADRGRNDESYRLNVPGQRSMDETSRRSSLSEASGLSSASTRTYINEASTLVLETIENGIKKHYLVPLSLAQKSKWRKKGTKLHIFNDHTFVAKHLQGGTVCQVCGKSIARRFGKQGYECRDCLLKCHKHCHVKVNDNCPESKIHNLELSYITNPYTDKNISIL